MKTKLVRSSLLKQPSADLLLALSLAALVKWLPSRPRESVLVLTLLTGIWLANFAAIYWFTWLLR